MTRKLITTIHKLELKWRENVLQILDVQTIIHSVVRLSVNPTHDIINQIIYFSATLPQTGINVTQPIFAGVILIISGIAPAPSKFTKKKR